MDHTVLPATHTFIHKWDEPSCRRASPQFGRYSFHVPLRVGGWVGPGGLVKYRGGLPVRRRSPIPILAAAAIESQAQRPNHYSLHGIAPRYLSDLLCNVADLPTRSRLLSSTSRLLDVRRSRLVTVGDRSLPRDAMLARYEPSSCVCLSVSLSVTSRCSTETAKRRMMQVTSDDSAGTLVFWRRNSNGVTPNVGAKCRWSRWKLSTFTSNYDIT